MRSPRGGVAAGAALAVAVIALALATRLWRLDLSLFEIDEAALLRLAEDLVRLGRVPLVGPVFSTGIPSAPHFIYLLAPVVAVSRDPAVASGAMAIASVAAIGGTLWLGWRGFGPVAGLVAAALYAATPWAIFYARRIWQPDILPLFSVGLFVLLEVGVVEHRAWWAATSVPLVALGVLVHPSFGPLAVFAAPALLVLARGRHWLPLGTALVVSVALSTPYVVHQVQTRFVDVANLRYFASLHTWLDFDALGYITLLTSGLVVPNDLLVPPLDRGLPAGLVQAGGVLALALAAFGFGLILLRGVRARGLLLERARLVAVMGWIAIPVVLSIRHTVPLQAHYFLASEPGVFLAVGIGVAWLWRLGSAVRPAAAAVVLATVALQAGSVIGALQAAPAQADPCYPDSLRAAEGQARELVEFGRADAATRASIESNTDDALPLAYLLRSEYAEVDLNGIGAFGLGAPRGPAFAGAPAAVWLTQSSGSDLDSASGMRVRRLAFGERPWRDQRIALALTWQVDPGATSNHPHVWEAALVDAAQQAVFVRRGVDHVPAELAGQTGVSWFTLDPAQEDPGSLSAGTYQLRLRLIDTWVPQTVPLVARDGGSMDAFTVGPVTLPALIRCTGA